MASAEVPSLTPPTPRGCEWRRADEGWNLWRHWSEKDPATSEKIKKARYAGYLSDEALAKMKNLDYETFTSLIGQRLRHYGQKNTPLNERVFEPTPLQEEADNRKTSSTGNSAVSSLQLPTASQGKNDADLAGKSLVSSTGKPEPADHESLRPMTGSIRVSSTGKPTLTLVGKRDLPVLEKTEVSSTGKTPKIESQLELINAPSAKWKQGKDTPPYPPKHEPAPHGKLDVGKRRYIGWQILRRIPCASCGKRIRPVMGYISPTAMIGLERENYETQVGIVRNILRRAANRNLNLRCASCDARGARTGLPDSSPARLGA